VKVKFSSHSIVAGTRGITIINMIRKGESSRTENGEVFLLSYKPDGRVKILITDAKTGGKESWAILTAQKTQEDRYGKAKTDRKKN
jgi:hypothetical protein